MAERVARLEALLLVANETAFDHTKDAAGGHTAEVPLAGSEELLETPARFRTSNCLPIIEEVPGHDVSQPLGAPATTQHAPRPSQLPEAVDMSLAVALGKGPSQRPMDCSPSEYSSSRQQCGSCLPPLSSNLQPVAPATLSFAEETFEQDLSRGSTSTPCYHARCSDAAENSPDEKQEGNSVYSGETVSQVDDF